MWKLDRAGRSLKHLIELLKNLQERGIEFISLTEQIDTTTPGGKLIFHLMGSLSEFERDLIRERTNAGLAAASTMNNTLVHVYDFLFINSCELSSTSAATTPRKGNLAFVLL